MLTRFVKRLCACQHCCVVADFSIALLVAGRRSSTSGRYVLICISTKERRGAYGDLVTRREVRRRFEDLDVNERIIIKWIFDK